VVVAVVGVAEGVWMFQGSGLTLLMRAVNRVLGLH
jgi:hypothetical protein